jgi:hypothetical protein
MDLAALKQKYRFIFCTELAGRLIYWRPLTLKEHDIYLKIIQMGLSSLGKIQDTIFKEIVLSEDVIDEMHLSPPGLVPSIVETALSISGIPIYSENCLEQVNTQLSEMRQSIYNNTLEQFIILICRAFPTYTPSEIENLEYQEVLRLLIMAEQILQLENPIELQKPKEPKSLTSKLFEDGRRARLVENADPPEVSIRDIYNEQQNNSSIKQARQAEMIRRFREKRTQ